MEKRLFGAGGLLFLGAAGLLLAARRLPGFAVWYAETVYPVLVAGFGRFFGLFPFSVVELGLYGLVALLFGCLIKLRQAPLRSLAVLFFTASFLGFSYMTGCGVNYYRRPFSSYLKLERGSDAEHLKELCLWLTDGVNEARKELDETPDPYGELERKGVRAMERLGERYPSLMGYYPPPKPVALSGILSVQQYSGVYSPFTVEANYNRDMVPYNIPHTICHELSHLRGFMREDEANFIGYLACLESEDADYRYSGYLLGWIYACNALAAEDYGLYGQLYDRLPEKTKAELSANRRFWARYEGKAAEAAARVNDTYLKAHGQEEGIKTYGRVVDLMLQDFCEKRGKEW